MSEMNRVQRWRQQQREVGKEALTIWLPRELKLFVEDIALKRHCSPSDLVQQALTTCYPLGADVTDTVTDTNVTDVSQIRLMLQQELRAFVGDIHLSQGIAPAQPITDTVTDTSVQAEAVRAAIEIPYVTDTVTDTGTVTDAVTDIYGCPVPEEAMDHQGEHITDTVTDTHVQAQDVTAAALETRLATDTVTDTSSQTENERVAIRALHGVTDTITDTQTEPSPLVTDTVTATGQALEPFDTTRYRLGKLCQRGHDYQSTGQSLRTTNKAGYCLACNAEDARARRQAKRQEVSA
jgi:hypothetical protein